MFGSKLTFLLSRVWPYEQAPADESVFERLPGRLLRREGGWGGQREEGSLVLSFSAMAVGQMGR